jgi:hypothetical protein
MEHARSPSRPRLDIELVPSGDGFVPAVPASGECPRAEGWAGVEIQPDYCIAKDRGGDRNDVSATQNVPEAGKFGPTDFRADIMRE